MTFDRDRGLPFALVRHRILLYWKQGSYTFTRGQSLDFNREMLSRDSFVGDDESPANRSCQILASFENPYMRNTCSYHFQAGFFQTNISSRAGARASCLEQVNICWVGEHE